jgi:hypothetical protein
MERYASILVFSFIEKVPEPSGSVFFGFSLFSFFLFVFAILFFCYFYVVFYFLFQNTLVILKFKDLQNIFKFIYL